MSLARRGMTFEEFLAWDAGQEGRWEFDGFEPVAMVGGTWAHSTICLNIGSALKGRLRGRQCRVVVEGLGLRMADRLRYPDVMVICAPFDAALTSVVEATVVFEVQSPSSAGTDQMVKAAEYRSTPSIMRYVMVAQDRIAVNYYERRGDLWVGTLVTEPGAVLEMPEIGVSLPLAEIYEDMAELG